MCACVCAPMCVRVQKLFVCPHSMRVLNDPKPQIPLGIHHSALLWCTGFLKAANLITELTPVHAFCMYTCINAYIHMYMQACMLYQVLKDISVVTPYCFDFWTSS